MADIIDETQPLDSGLAGNGASDIRATRAALNNLNDIVALLFTVGDVKFNDSYIAPSASHPWYPLTNDDTVITSTNWPDLVTHWRGKKIYYMPGTSSSKSAFAVTNWAIATNVATLTFANTTAENKILAALAEDQLIQGSYTDWRTITLASSIGSITAGTYAITAINAVARTVSFAFIASNGSGSVTATAEFYPHRLSSAVDSTGVQARHFKVQGRGFFTVNDADGEFILGLRRRDRMQGHWHESHSPTNPSGGSMTYFNAAGTTGSGSAGPQIGTASAPVTDGTNGDPRTGKKTHGPGFGVIAYIYGKTYSA